MLRQITLHRFIVFSVISLLVVPAFAFANTPPWNPTPVWPSIDADNIGLTPMLAWDCIDKDGDALTYDVYFGKELPPPLVASGVASKTYYTGALEEVTKYYWMIDAHDPSGAMTRSGIFDFTTQVHQVPHYPWGPVPFDDQHGVPVWQTLSWNRGGTPTHHYDIYFGKQSPPPLLASNLPSASFRPGDALEHGVTYYWKIVVRDEQGFENEGAVWKFTTAKIPAVNPASVPPDNGCVPPGAYNPPPDSVLTDSAPVLQWSVTQPNGLPMRCHVYFGESAPTGDNQLEMIAGGVVPSSGTKKFSYVLHHPIEAGHQYYWQVVVLDGVDSSRGPVWSFTGCGDAPGEPLKSIATAPYPNPFNPLTTIPYVGPAGSVPVPVRLVIYDAAGRAVRTLVNEKQPAGARSVEWNGANERNQRSSSGVYFCVIQVGNERRTQKLVLLK